VTSDNIIKINKKMTLEKKNRGHLSDPETEEPDVEE